MFCARCGQQIPDVAQICPLCGREANITLAPATPAAATPFEHAPVVPFVPGPNGIGGWLLIYCISLTTLAPVSVLLFYSFAFRRHVFNPGIVLDLARVLYGAMVGIFLWTRRPAALALLRIYYIAVAASIVLFALQNYAYSLRVHGSIFLRTTLPSLMINAAITLLWFAYFCRSVRVKNTYGRNLLERAPEL